MKRYFLALVCAIFTTIANAQAPITVTSGTISRTTPLIGLNSNGHLSPNCPASSGNLGANWTQNAFIDSVAYIYPEVLRYPGGTVGNHWDWNTGWYLPTYGPPCTALTVRVDEFSAGLTASNAEGLYVMNMETSNAHYQTDGIRHAMNIGINPKYIELGNEHNLVNGVFSAQLMTESVYATTAKQYYDSIISVLPTAKIAIVGGKNANWTNWPTTTLGVFNNFDAVTWHPYPNANNTDLAFHLNRALAVPFGPLSLTGSLANMYSFGNFNSPSLASKEIWVTEYNLNELANASVPTIATTWSHFLYVNAMHDYFLKNPKITMIINHAAASIDSIHASIRVDNQSLTANAVAMKLLLDVSRGSLNCTDMNFSGSSSMTYSTSTIPKLTGWIFDSPSEKNGFICNYSKDTFKVSLSSIFSTTMQYTQFSADTSAQIHGLHSLTQVSGTSSDSILIAPFSFTQIFTNLTTGIKYYSVEKEAINIYPNPFTSTTTLQTDNVFKDATLIVYNLQGQQVKQIKNISGKTITLHRDYLPMGLYFIHLTQDNKTITTDKLIITD